MRSEFGPRARLLQNSQQFGKRAFATLESIQSEFGNKYDQNLVRHSYARLVQPGLAVVLADPALDDNNLKRACTQLEQAMDQYVQSKNLSQANLTH